MDRLQQLVAVDGLVVLNVLLRDGQFITLKVWPAVRAARAEGQLLAERRAGEMFPWHPTMTTVLAISRNPSSGNFTTVTQWAGYSLQDLIDDPAWWQQPLIVRAIVAQRVARCIFMGLATMHTAVSGGRCCFPAAGTRGVCASVHDTDAGDVIMCTKRSCDMAVNVTLSCLVETTQALCRRLFAVADAGPPALHRLTAFSVDLSHTPGDTCCCRAAVLLAVLH
jgi:hypothetical protein